jgi:hypothetical protein
VALNLLISTTRGWWYQGSSCSSSALYLQVQQLTSTCLTDRPPHKTTTTQAYISTKFECFLFLSHRYA